MTALRKLMKSIAKEPAGNTLQYHKDKLKLHTDAFKTSMDNEKKHGDLYRAAKKEGNQAAAEFHDGEAEKHLKDAEEHSEAADTHRRVINNGNKAGGMAKPAKPATLASAKLGTREKLDLKLKHHEDMNYWHMLKAVHHEKEYKTSGDPKHNLAMEHHMESADYHSKMAGKVHNKIMDHIGRNQAR